MPSKITLAAATGPLAGQKFVFDERTTCIIGRLQDCDVCIPLSESEKRTVSRHHCILDINPPDVRIRDFGSLNGTWVNGRKIGQREKGTPPEAGQKQRFPEHDLKDGDEVRVGNSNFRVSVRIPVYCVKCAAELDPPDPAEMPSLSVEIACKACGYVIRPAKPKAIAAAAPKPPRTCTKCGRDVTAEAGQRPGEYVCGECRNDPYSIMKRMLECASSGERKLVAIDGYEVRGELGRGGMGAVYLARHQLSGREVALKVMLPQVAATPNAAARFLREVEMTKSLVHPNIVRLFESGCHLGTFFLTLEYCNLRSVDRVMQARNGRLPIDEAVPIIRQVLKGLAYAHEVQLSGIPTKDGKKTPVKGLVHRDLKPANIFLQRYPQGVVAKVGDYGLAKAFDLAGLSGHTVAGAVGGTPYFMPRQQVLKFKFARPEVDVWAAAASLYYMLTGKLSRDFKPEDDPWLTVLHSSPIPIRERDPKIPAKLAQVIDEALVDDPEIKIKSALELKAELEKAVQ